MATVSDLLAAARICLDSQRASEAAQLCRGVLSAEPANPAAWHLLAVSAYQCGDFEAAVECAERSLDIRENQPEVFNNLGLIYQVRGLYDQAVASYRRAIAIKPGYATAYFNLGNALRDQRDLNGARLCYAIAIEFAPDFAEARVAVAALHLLLGEYDRGWPGYEWRLRTGQVVLPEFHRPRWKGEELGGRPILLHVEQGLGDNIQFVRYCNCVRRHGGVVFVGCQRPLVRLLSSSRSVDRVLASGDDVPPIDYQASLLSLPGIFNTTLETIPREVPYLFADRALIHQWREKLAAVVGGPEARVGRRELLIGINWQGRSGQGIFRQRDMPLEHFVRLAEMPGVRLISLQKGEGREELARRVGSAHQIASEDAVVGRAHPTIIDLGDEVDTTSGAFMDTAAIMMNLDLVITSDTAIPHLAGALGVPVWLALPFVPDWRWMLDRSDSPWYPTMRLFRQKRPGDWKGVFEEIRAELAELVRRKQAGIA